MLFVVICLHQKIKKRLVGIIPILTRDFSKARCKEPFAALAFKIATDPFVGRLAFFRAYSGRLDAGSYVLNNRSGNKERISRIYQMHSNKQNAIDFIEAGDIGAAVGFKDIKTGDTFLLRNIQSFLEAMDFPDPVIGIAVEPKTKADVDKLGMALAKLAEEDPTFQVKTDEASGQTIISGMGELHLDIIVDRLRREFKVEVNQGQPQVEYKEALLLLQTTEKFTRNNRVVVVSLQILYLQLSLQKKEKRVLNLNKN